MNMLDIAHTENIEMPTAPNADEIGLLINVHLSRDGFTVSEMNEHGEKLLRDALERYPAAFVAYWLQQGERKKRVHCMEARRSR